MKSRLEELEQELKERGILRVADLVPMGFPKSYLSELEKRGKAIKQTRGVYMHSEADIPPHYSLALACQKVPGGVVCLLSALAYHEIGTQNPHEVWMAIDRKARMPKVDYPPIRIVRFSGSALEEGIEKIEGPFPIRVYNEAKTVADCFKYRNKFGLDVAVEALREGWRMKRITVKELDRYARICRVEKIITPYLEAIL
ncbi:transcriptional regulator [Puniceicoccales bacterium CK1056]|uniref:Transcriptional regulator n=1 Tax=Oceanipulchritudo coccoides TaxID=2706888 RepID=A0A6B2LY44_9BACT|nr:type IV toxin-antitoxin system AbiEi family antitoxin domain-containing protein [Oceanipulchritudo coccoides]NDV61538.1 transcriptional regulator [Oceanipulchritudo coccoides]